MRLCEGVGFGERGEVGGQGVVGCGFQGGGIVDRRFCGGEGGHCLWMGWGEGVNGRGVPAVYGDVEEGGGLLYGLGGGQIAWDFLARK